LYRKYHPQQLFNGYEMLSAGQVLICKSNGAIADIVRYEQAGDDIQELDGLLCPGFINAHCHIELSHLKGVIKKHTGLVAFVQQVMKQRLQYSDDQIQEAMHEAAANLFENGVVAVADICNAANSISLKKTNPIYWHNFVEVSGFVDAGAQKRFDDGKAILDQFLKNDMPATLTPHAPYSVSKKLFQLINDFTEGQLISIHNQEAAAENELYQQKSGDFLKLYQQLGIDIGDFNPTSKSSLQSWVPWFDREQRLVSVHNSFISTADMQFATSRDIHYCICINANLYIENVVPPIDKLLEQGAKLLIGTDSLASNESLDMMTEINTIQQHFPQIPLPIILRWATSNAAEVLGIQSKFGSFDSGKQPGLVLIREGKSKLIV
jgi:cytosine/adenosine deaminase-related metal-dependent hydrolase